MTLPATVRLPDGSTLVVRLARPEDAEAWIANVSAVAAERVLVLTEAFPRTVEEVRSQFRDADPERALWLVAEVDGAVVGGANVARGRWEKDRHTGELGISLTRPFRGRGIGEAVMREGLAWAERVGIRKVCLGVFATNEPAIALYRKLGFVEEGRLRDQVVLDGRAVDKVLMACWLGPRPGAGT